MWGFLTVCVFCGAAIWWWLRVEPHAVRLLTKVSAPRPAPQEPIAETPPDAMPQALLDVAMSYTDDWAKEQSLKAMRELYDTTKDWGAVQALMMRR